MPFIGASGSCFWVKSRSVWVCAGPSSYFWWGSAASHRATDLLPPSPDVTHRPWRPLFNQLWGKCLTFPSCHPTLHAHHLWWGGIVVIFIERWLNFVLSLGFFFFFWFSLVYLCMIFFLFSLYFLFLAHCPENLLFFLFWRKMRSNFGAHLI